MNPNRPRTPSLHNKLKTLTARYGRGALLPFQLGEDKFIYCPNNNESAVSYGLLGGTVVVVGEPIGRLENQARVLEAFITRNHRMGRKTTFYQIGTATRDFLIQRGYYCFGVGQEAIIELASFGLDGPARANLRHTITRAQKGGLSARFYRTGIGGDEGLLQKLRLLDRAWQAQAGRPMGFTINAYDQDALRIFPVAVVFAAQEAVAFATFRPTNQAETCWVLDLMRRERHAEPGAMEWAIAQAATAFKTQGGEELSLGLAPLYGLSINQGPMAERLLALGARLVRRWYNINSLGFFKTKFAPRWEPRYGAVPSRRASLGFYLTLLRLHTRRTLLSPVARPPAQEVA